MQKEGYAFWNKYAAQAQLDVLVAAYSKVGQNWRDEDFTPDYNKMYYIREGSGYVKLDGRTYYPRPGELYFLPAGRQQSYGTLEGREPFGKYWCHFRANVGGLELFQLVETPTCVSLGDRADIKQLFEQLIARNRDASLASEFRVRALMFELLANYLEAGGPPKWNTGVSASFEKMSQVLRYIELHLAESLNVETLARIAHFHPNYFINVFRSFTGYSPIQYINRMRLEKAKHLVATTELSVSAIAATIGMELPYFSRMFKEHTGLAPTAYREMVPRG
ncbi:helix-turn-helix transcriptional regulator [Paenibacillus sp. IB182496]|uniref:Helix-turn-helix transcriptional regulator n=1 Tax=Paenibacillus sabuli TaxID=2772509 RepID=A0A927BX25_9BACL|nr:AraC family transcriptional regulator [Paenibacillus sabuli]MBD2846923.1 helix-turn-helix transcriptional regulator [Paenibacillus sabuli]